MLIYQYVINILLILLYHYALETARYICRTLNIMRKQLLLIVPLKTLYQRGCLEVLAQRFVGVISPDRFATFSACRKPQHDVNARDVCSSAPLTQRDILN